LTALDDWYVIEVLARQSSIIVSMPKLGITICFIFLLGVMPIAFFRRDSAALTIEFVQGFALWLGILTSSWIALRRRKTVVKATEYDATSSTELIRQQATALLAPVMPSSFKVTYDPFFPRADGSTFSWFQVVFAVGPGEETELRELVHATFEKALTRLARLRPAIKSDHVTLRARRHVPPTTDPKWPHMFIECSWRGTDLRALILARDMTQWHAVCQTYLNRASKDDPLTRHMKKSGADDAPVTREDKI